MTKRPRLSVALAASMAALPVTSYAQSLLLPRNTSGYPYFVVQNCGTASFGSLLNSYAPGTIDVTGTQCTVAGSGGSGGGGSSGPVYGPDPQGNAPSRPPVLMGLLDATGNVRALSSINPAAVSVGNFPAVQPISGTVGISGTPTFNLSQFAGTAVATGAGASNAGTLRVILSTDSPGGTGGGGSSFAGNITQFGGSNVVTGTGASGAGIPRVTVSSDSFPSIQPVSGTVNVGNFPATQAVSWANQSVAITGTVTVDGSAKTQPVSGSVSVSNFPTTQTVSGTVTANIGTTNGLALDSSTQAVKTALGSPFQAGGSIGNTAFGISGTLPAFTSTPTFNIGTGLPTSYPDTAADAVLGTTSDPAYTSGTGAATVPSLLRGIANKIDAGSQAPLVAGSALIGGTTAYIGSSPASNSNPVPVSVQSGGTVVDASGTATEAVTTSGATTSGTIALSSRSELVAHITGLTATGATVSGTMALADGSYVTTAATPFGGAPSTPTITADGWYRFKIYGAGTFQFSGTAGTTAGTVNYAYTATSNPGTVSATITNSVTNPVKSDISANLNPNGQQPMAASSPVVIASNQSALPVTGTFFQSIQPISAASLPLPTGAATAAGQAAQQGSVAPGNAAVNSILDGGIYNSAGVTLSNGQQAAIQMTSAGRLLADIAPNLNANGQTTMANSSPVAIASNQSAIPVTGAFYQTTQPISGTVTANIGTAPTLVVQGLAGGTAVPVSGTFFQATQPISATALPLPAGAATASGQAAQQGSATGGIVAANSVLDGGVYRASGVTLTDGQQAGLQLDTSGRLQANIAASLNTNGAKTSALSSPTVLATDQSFQRTLQFTEFNASTTAATTTYNGAVRTPGTNYTKFKTAFYSTQAGTANVQGCLDSACSTSFTIATAAVSATTPVVVPVDVIYPYYRAQFVNGSTAGALTLNDALNSD